MAYRVDDLLRMVSDGQIRLLPRSQPPRWNDNDRLTLFDSVYRGFPVGALLLWKREAKAGVVRFGELPIGSVSRSDALWVVDGQQRVVTLVEALLRQPTRGERVIYFDLITEAFHYANTPSADGANAATPRSIPIATLFDSSRLTRWLAEHRPDSGLRAHALAAHQQIRAYAVPAYVVETEDPALVQEIFLRLNVTGKPLREHDVLETLLSLLTPEQPSSLGHVAALLKGLGFGEIGHDVVLDALRATRRLPPHRAYPDDGSLRPAAPPLALRDVEASLREAIIFLRRDAGIPHRALLPHDRFLIALALFFHHFPEPSTRNRLLLRRWLWRSALGQPFRHDPVSGRRALDSIQPDDEHGSVQRLLTLAGHERPEDAFALAPFNLRTAHGKLQCCALASLNPCDLRTGDPFDIHDLFSADLDAPAARVVDIGRLDGADPGLANRLLHPPLHPASALATALASTTDDRVLASHAISPEAQRALRAGDYPTFFAERAKSLHDVLGAYFRRQAEWGADDSPPLDSLVVEED
jgi:hypothetical protein